MLIPFRRKAAATLPVAVFPLAALARKGGDGALCVVCRDKIHQHMQRGRGVIFADAQNRICGTARAAAAQKAQHGAAEGVVHDRIQRGAERIFAAGTVAELGDGVLPDLAEHHGVGSSSLTAARILASVSSGQLVGHVQPPAVRPCPQPPRTTLSFPPKINSR